jgi:hypothetical protein
MCGRFARKSTQEVLADWFGVELEDKVLLCCASQERAGLRPFP